MPLGVNGKGRSALGGEAHDYSLPSLSLSLHFHSKHPTLNTKTIRCVWCRLGSTENKRMHLEVNHIFPPSPSLSKHHITFDA